MEHIISRSIWLHWIPIRCSTIHSHAHALFSYSTYFSIISLTCTCLYHLIHVQVSLLIFSISIYRNWIPITCNTIHLHAHVPTDGSIIGASYPLQQGLSWCRTRISHQCCAFPYLLCVEWLCVFSSYERGRGSWSRKKGDSTHYIYFLFFLFFGCLNK